MFQIKINYAEEENNKLEKVNQKNVSFKDSLKEKNDSWKDSIIEAS